MTSAILIPVWISRFGPKIALAMALHSICQPGRPRPHGDSHDGSPGREFFHKAKSAGDLFSSPRSAISSPNQIKSIMQISYAKVGRSCVKISYYLLLQRGLSNLPQPLGPALHRCDLDCFDTFVRRSTLIHCFRTHSRFLLS